MLTVRHSEFFHAAPVLRTSVFLVLSCSARWDEGQQHLAEEEKQNDDQRNDEQQQEQEEESDGEVPNNEEEGDGEERERESAIHTRETEKRGTRPYTYIDRRTKTAAARLIICRAKRAHTLSCASISIEGPV